MVVANGRVVGCDDLDATVWCIICSLSFLTVVVTDIVSVLLVKLEHKKIFHDVI